MKDQPFTLKLDEYLLRKLAERAEMMGVTPEHLAAEIIGDQLAAPGPEDDLAEEGARDWSEVRPELEAYLQERLKSAAA